MDQPTIIPRPIMPADDGSEPYYTPERIASLLWCEDGRCGWAALRELAVQTAPSSSHFEPSPAFGTRRRYGYHWAEVVADLERAWIRLPRWSLPFQMIEWSMAGWSIPTIADGLRVSLPAATMAYHRACRDMAVTLGWRG